MAHRILLLGLGFWGRRWMELIQKTKRVELAGFCGTQDEIKAACEKYSLSADIAFTDYKEAIAKTKAEIAVIVIPGVLHFDADRLAMEKGMNVITEKPLTMSMDEAKKLLEIKKKTGVKFMTCQNFRWRTNNQTIKKAIQDGLIGEVEQIMLEFRQQEDLQGYRAGLEQPLVQDVSIHHFDLLRLFTGSKLKSVYAVSYHPSWSVFKGRPNTDAIIEMENGVRIAYNGSWAARGKESCWEGNFTITGSKGCLTLDADHKVWFYPFKKVESVVIDMQAETGTELPQVEMQYTEMEYGLNHMLDCLENDTTPETTLEDNIYSFDMVSTTLLSVQSGKTEKSQL